MRRWTKRNKYGSIPTAVGSEVLDSKREARDYQGLLTLQRGGQIGGLARQARIPLVVDGVKIADYLADFAYFERGKFRPGRFEERQRWLIARLYNEARFDPEEWTFVLHDSKGWRTQVYRLKAKLVKALYGITIRET